MRRSIFTALAVLFLAGCGSSPVVPSQPKPPACHPSVPAHMGVCVQQRFGSTKPTGGFGALGIDISTYQGSPDFAYLHRNGLRFAINQTGDGEGFRDYNFASNVRRERAAGVVPGSYHFMRPGCGSCQADAMIAVIDQVGQQGMLPPALDVEVPGSYSTVCSAAARLKERLHTDVLVYTSPGLSQVQASCGTKLWAAEWGSSGYAFPPWSSYVAQQTCGTCGIGGVSGEVDIDRDHGLLGSSPPAPKPIPNAELHRRLNIHYRARVALRRLILVHRCALGGHRHATPAGYREVCNDWIEAGQHEVAVIAYYHRRGIY